MQLLDILPPPSREDDPHQGKHYIQNEYGDIVIVGGDDNNLHEETPANGNDAPLLDGSKSELSSTAVAGLAVALLLGVALAIMSKLSVKN